MSTLNNKQAARAYVKEYMQLFDSVFGVDKAFGRAFSPLQMTDGIRHNEVAFYVKTNNTPVVIQSYDTGVNVGMGTGTSSSNRFGPRQEIKYTDTPASYNLPLAFHEGLDRFTVNAGLDEAVLDRLLLIAEQHVLETNLTHGEFLADNAGNEVVLASYGNDDVAKLFNDLATYQTNKRIRVKSVAYVQSELYNAIVDHPLVTTSKNARVDINGNVVHEFKDFIIQKEAADDFPEGVIAIIAPDSVAIPFIGVESARAIESEDFDGVALQGASKTGQFILDDNKVAVTKVTLTETP